MLCCGCRDSKPKSCDRSLDALSVELQMLAFKIIGVVVTLILANAFLYLQRPKPYYKSG